MVDSLEAPGLVERDAEPDDRRVTMSKVSVEGRGLIAERRRARTHALADATDQLPESDPAALIEPTSAPARLAETTLARLEDS